MSRVLMSIFILLFIGCATKEEIKKSYLITFKTPNLQYHDMGFIKFSNSINLSIFSFGQVILNLEIGANLICLNSQCLLKEQFNSKFLSSNYDKDILEQIINCKEILNGVGKKETKDGFTQEIQNSNFDIIYQCFDDVISFKDKKNGVFIKLKEIK